MNTNHQVIQLTDAVVLRGQRAWGRIKATAAEQRQLWREVGEALNYGRSLNSGNQAFGAWCRGQGFDMKADLRADAMWLAENWSVIGASEDATHPTWIRKTYREAQSTLIIPDLSLDLADSPQVTNVEAVAAKASSLHRLAKMGTDTGPEGKEARRRLDAFAERHGMTREQVEKTAAEIDKPRSTPPQCLPGLQKNIEEVTQLAVQLAVAAKRSQGDDNTSITRALALSIVLEVFNAVKV